MKMPRFILNFKHYLNHRVSIRYRLEINICKIIDNKNESIHRYAIRGEKEGDRDWEGERERDKGERERERERREK